MQGHEIALTQNSATIANGASTVIAVAALGISSRHNYIGSIRGKGIECPRTLANLRLPQHLAPPSQGSLSFVSRPQSKFSHPSSPFQVQASIHQDDRAALSLMIETQVGKAIAMKCSADELRNHCANDRQYRSMPITRTHPIITMTNNGMMRFVKSISFGIASFRLTQPTNH